MPDYKNVSSEGKFEKHETGAHRDTREGKGRFDLIPPHGLIRLAKHYENGAKKYGDDNWRKGLPQKRYCDSAIRHLFKYLGGDRSEDHLAAVAWNVFAMMHQEEMIERCKIDPKLDDMNYDDFKDGEFNEKGN